MIDILTDPIPSLILTIGTLLILAWGVLRYFTSGYPKPKRSDEWIIFPKSRSAAKAVADERARFLNFELERRSTRESRAEIREIPPGYKDLRDEDLSREAAVAQLANIKWQLKNPDTLPLWRAIDSLVIIARSESISLHELRPTIKLCSSEFPYSTASNRYSLQIECTNPSLVRERLRPLASWIGMGTKLRIGSAGSMPYGSCQMGVGLGVVDGAVFGETIERHSLTCAHLVGQNCQSLRFGDVTSVERIGPDAVLLALPSPCFPISSLGPPQTPVENERLRELLRLQSKIEKYTHETRSRAGYLTAIAGIVHYGNRTYEFPHAVIRDYRQLFLDLLPWPPFARPFAGPGHSGSWVKQRHEENWLAMVVAGSPEDRETLAALAKPLIEYFEGLTGEGLTAISVREVET